jgi:hypothetical protein
MDLAGEISREYSLKQVKKIALNIGNNQMLFSDLVDSFFAKNYRTNQRSAAIMAEVLQTFPELLEPHIWRFTNLLSGTQENTFKRNILRVLQYVEVPEIYWVALLEKCFEFLTSPKEAVAIKVFSMQLIFNICKKEPDLKNELRVLIEDQLPLSSAGFKSRGRKILKLLQNL